MTSVVPFPRSDRHMPSPESALAEASEAGLHEIVVLGLTSDGHGRLFVSNMSGPTMLWLLEWAKAQLMEHA